MKYASKHSTTARTLISATAVMLSFSLTPTAHAFNLGDIARVVVPTVVLPGEVARSTGSSIVKHISSGNFGSIARQLGSSLDHGNAHGYTGMNGGDSEPFNGKGSNPDPYAGKAFIKSQPGTTSQPANTLSNVVCVKAPCNPMGNQTQTIPPVQDVSKSLRPFRLETPASPTTRTKQPSTTTTVNKRVQKDRLQRLNQLRKTRSAHANPHQRQAKLRARGR